MNNEIKNLLWNIAYWGILILSVIDICLLIYAVGLLIITCASFFITMDGELMAIFTIAKSGVVNILLSLLFIAIAVIGGKFLFQARIVARRNTEYDEEGLNKKFNSYEKLSAKEKEEFDKVKLMQLESLIDSATLRKITASGSATPDEDMQKLIGLSQTKEKMHEMAARMEFEQQERKREKKNKKNKNENILNDMSMHMCFMGPPGTGKTTCARIMTGFLYKYGYIKENKIIEVDGNFLKGGYKGETTDKTKLLLTKARHGVLFIDEAYALLDYSGSGYGQEAIATIVKEMEDHRGDIVIIFAGYDREMKEFVNSNPGLFSRIKHYLYFDSYDLNDLGKIFTLMAKEKGYEVKPEALINFEERMNIEKTQNNFGNARTVRNCLEQAIDKHAVNIIDGKIREEDRKKLCPEDITVISREASFFNTDSNSITFF